MAVFGVEQRVAVTAGGKKKKKGFVPAVAVCVWPENTQCLEYLCTQVGHRENNWLFTWPINDGTLLLLGLFVFMKKTNAAHCHSWLCSANWFLQAKKHPGSKAGDKEKHRKETEKSLFL